MGSDASDSGASSGPGGRRGRAWLLAAVLAALGTGACGSAEPEGRPAAEAADPGRWRVQLSEDLVDPWIRRGRDERSGRFVTHLGPDWSRRGPEETYPSMVGRHLFSLSAAFLATGDERYLDLADSVRSFLVERGWDPEHGGWFDRLGPDGEPADSTKSTFVQTYAASGLALHHFVTLDSSSSRLVRETNQLLEDHARDRDRGGYVQALEYDLSVADSLKKVASQLAPVSGYLLYHLAATRDRELLAQASRLMEITWTRMRDPRSGWIRERFGPDWSPRPGEDESYNVGHNLEAAWMLERLALASTDLSGTDSVAGMSADSAGDAAYLLGRSVAAAAYRPTTGAWIQSVSAPELEPRRERVVWWIHAYGAMADATLHRISREPDPRERYWKATRFWNEHLLDREGGGTHLAVGPGGELTEGRKGGRWKTSYHSVEHALWNWWSEALWMDGSGMTLHFRPAPEAAGDTVHPILVPDPAVRVIAVRQRGEDRAWIVEGGRGVALPPDLPAGAVVTVELSSIPASPVRDRSIDSSKWERP